MRNEIQPVILTDKKWKQMGMFTLKQYRSVYQAEWIVNPLTPECYSLIPNNFSPNFGDDLNFDTYEHSLIRFNAIEMIHW